MDSKTYSNRRKTLRDNMSDEAILILGHDYAPRNYLYNPYPFRQNSHILYYTGINVQSIAILLTPNGQDFLFGSDPDTDDLVWTGPQPLIADLAEGAGMKPGGDFYALENILAELQKNGKEIHYPPPYRADSIMTLSVMLNMSPGDAALSFSRELVTAIINQRSKKTDDEVAQIEDALVITAKQYEAATAVLRPGVTEAEVVGALQGAALSFNRAQSFLPICSVRGEVLHNDKYGNTLSDKDLLVIDSGAESELFYASDITRTYPVSGTFDQRQREIYDIVLAAQAAAIEKAGPGVTNLEVHLAASTAIAKGLVDTGLLKGDVDQIVQAGAHALFFPHGTGHMLGLDAHDMEDLGDEVGYAKGEKRSEQFGLSFLRLARKLEPGFVITAEPGIYFIPALIDLWKSEKKFEEFINYDLAQSYKGFGGIRIEDDVLISENGSRVLGPGIPKTEDEIEGLF